MKQRFIGQSALITGAASGLGAECARQFASEGASLVLVDLDASGLAVLSRELDDGGFAARSIVGSVADANVAEDAVAVARREFGGINVLVNNAGIDPLHAGTITNTTEPDWDRVIAVNLKGAFLFSRACLPMLIARRGAIVSTASSSAILPSREETAYSVSKAALVQLTKCIALDYAAEGIRANCVCPGPLEAVMGDRRNDMTSTSLDARSVAAAAAIPMGREGKYGEIARSILFLASADASYITGAALVADGGLTLL